MWSLGKPSDWLRSWQERERGPSQDPPRTVTRKLQAPSWIRRRSFYYILCKHWHFCQLQKKLWTHDELRFPLAYQSVCWLPGSLSTCIPSLSSSHPTPILDFSSSWVSLPLASHSFTALLFWPCSLLVFSLSLSPSLLVPSPPPWPGTSCWPCLAYYFLSLL